MPGNARLVGWRYREPEAATRWFAITVEVTSATIVARPLMDMIISSKKFFDPEEGEGKKKRRWF